MIRTFPQVKMQLLLISLFTIGSISLAAQDRPGEDSKEDPPRGDEYDPHTGSGSAYGTHYSTLSYNAFIEQVYKERKNLRPQFEKQAHANRRKKFDKAERQIPLVFYNYTHHDARSFAREVEIQVKSLSRDFTIDGSTYSYLIRDEVEKEGSQNIFQFKILDNDYQPIKEAWKDWHSFQKDPRNPREGISIYVVSEMPASIGHGYASYSWDLTEETTGIVVRAADFGSGSGDFTEGRVLTHLLANYLGLLPLTGEGPCMDDYVGDTPVHESATFFCFEDPQKYLTSTCDFKPKMMQNFMSNGPDHCRSEFTLGQWKRMLEAFHFINQNQ